MLDSTIKLYQLNTPELSGYIESFFTQTSGNISYGSFNISGSGLIDVFTLGNSIVIGSNGYGLATSGDLSDWLAYLAVTNNALYYLNSNPNGFVSINTLETGQLTISNSQWFNNSGVTILNISPTTYAFNGPHSTIQLYSNVINPSGNPYISGFDIWAKNINLNTINGQTPITNSYISGNYVPYSLISPSSTGINYIYLKDNIKLISSKFDQGTDFYLVGQHATNISETYLIDLYGSLAKSYGLPSGHPFISGFDIYAGVLTSSGSPVLTVNSTDYYVTPEQLLSASGDLMVSILRYRGTGASPGMIIGSFSISGNSGIAISTDNNNIIISYTGAILTGNFITPEQTGAFYSSLNPSGFINSGNLSQILSYDGIILNNHQLVDFSNVLSIDYGSRFLNDQYENPSIDWNNYLLQFAGQPVFDWRNGIIYDNDIVFGQQESISTNNRLLYQTSGSFNINVSLDWQNQILSGIWNAQNLLINGNTITTGGPYYLLSNPLGYITGETLFNLYSGSYITTGQTGIFITTGQITLFATIANLNLTGSGLQVSLNNLNNWSGNSTGLYYPLFNNPSNYITGVNTGNFITTSQTGIFLTSSALIPYATTASLSAYVGTGSTGSFITNVQTGQFASVINLVSTGLTLQTEINTLNTWTGATSNLYINRNGDITTSNFTSSGNEYFSWSGLSGTNGLLYLQNISASTTGHSSSNAPSIIFSGQTWVSGAGGTGSQPTTWRIYESGISGNQSISQLNFDVSNNTGNYHNILSLTSSGVGYISGNQIITANQTGVFMPIGKFPDIYDVGGHVGIGQSGPSYQLDVNGTIGNTAGTLSLQSNNNLMTFSLNSTFLSLNGNGVDSNLAIQCPVGDMQFDSRGASVIRIGDVQGANFGEQLVVDSNNGYGYFENGNFGVRNTSPGYTLDVNGDIGNSLGGNLVLQDLGGNVGIGMSPSYQLDVNGNVRINNTIRCDNGELHLIMSGAPDGGSNLHLYNKDGLNGAEFENPSAGLIDFAFLTTAGDTLHHNLRVEQRGGSQVLAMNDPNNGGFGEFQYQIPGKKGGAFFALGASGAGFATTLWVNNTTFFITNDNAAPVYTLDVNGSIGNSKGGNLVLQTTGKVGIANKSPLYTLDVSGSGNFTSTITGSGIALTTRTWNTLTFNTGTTTWNANTYAIEDKAKLTLTGNTILGISGLYNGWVGVLQTIQAGSSSSGYSLTLPSGTKVMNAGSGIITLTPISGAYDMISFEYDGTKLFANIGANWT